MRCHLRAAARDSQSLAVSKFTLSTSRLFCGGTSYGAYASCSPQSSSKTCDERIILYYVRLVSRVSAMRAGESSPMTPVSGEPWARAVLDKAVHPCVCASRRGVERTSSGRCHSRALLLVGVLPAV